MKRHGRDECAGNISFAGHSSHPVPSRGTIEHSCARARRSSSASRARVSRPACMLDHCSRGCRAEPHGVRGAVPVALVSSAMRLLSVVLLVSWSLLAVAASHVVVEEVAAPASWVQVARAAPTTRLQLLVALTQQNTDALEAALQRTSDPDSTLYSQHWSNDDIHELIAPPSHNVKAVIAWLHAHGVDTAAMRHTPNHDMIRVGVSVAQAERLLHAEYFVFQHATHTQLHTVRTLRYAVPAHLASAIDIIGPTCRFPSGKLAIHDAHEHKNTHALKHGSMRLKQDEEKKRTHRDTKPKKTVGQDPSVCLAGPSTLSTTPACMRAVRNITAQRWMHHLGRMLICVSSCVCAAVQHRLVCGVCWNQLIHRGERVRAELLLPFGPRAVLHNLCQY